MAHGLAIGVLLAGFDVVFLLGLQAPFELLYVGSNALRMAAGAAGGYRGRWRCLAASVAAAAIALSSLQRRNP